MISTQKCSPDVCGQDLVLNVLGVVVSAVGRVQHVVPGEIQKEEACLQDKHFREVEVDQG